MKHQRSNIVAIEVLEGSPNGRGPTVEMLLRHFIAIHDYRVTAGNYVAAPFKMGSSGQVDFQQLIDEFLTWLEELGSNDVSEGRAKRAARIVIREDASAARAALINAVLAPLSVEERIAAGAAFRALAEKVFDDDPAIVEAVLGHFMAQAKRFMLGIPVTDHLMPILYGREQGSGKSTTARKLLEPLGELAGEMSFETILDERSRINTYVTLVDETEPQSNAAKIATLKRRISGTSRQSRQLFSHYMSTIISHSAFIGTSNMPVADSIDDPTGHRRFIDLHHRNGDVEKGGDPSVWETVNATDFMMLWRLVDPHAPSPIEAVRAQLATRQGPNSSNLSLSQFMRALDFEKEAKSMPVGQGDRVGARDLYEYFCERTGSKISQKRFSYEMYLLIQQGEIPFEKSQLDQKTQRDRFGRFYRIKRNFR